MQNTFSFEVSELKINKKPDFRCAELIPEEKSSPRPAQYLVYPESGWSVGKWRFCHRDTWGEAGAWSPGKCRTRAWGSGQTQPNLTGTAPKASSFLLMIPGVNPSLWWLQCWLNLRLRSSFVPKSSISDLAEKGGGAQKTALPTPNPARKLLPFPHENHWKSLGWPRILGMTKLWNKVLGWASRKSGHSLRVVLTLSGKFSIFYVGNISRLSVIWCFLCSLHPTGAVWQGKQEICWKKCHKSLKIWVMPLGTHSIVLPSINKNVKLSIWVFFFFLIALN